MKKMIMILAVALLLATAISSVNASTAGPECKILEKPETINVSCSTLFITLEDDVSEFTFLGAPEGVIDTINYTQLYEQSQIIKENLGTNDSIIPFPQESPDVAVKRGIYVIRINNEYNIKILYGGEINVKAVIEGITFYGGILLLISGLALTKFTKNRQLAKLAFILGGTLIIVFVITLFVSI